MSECLFVKKNCQLWYYYAICDLLHRLDENQSVRNVKMRQNWQWYCVFFQDKNWMNLSTSNVKNVCKRTTHKAT